MKVLHLVGFNEDVGGVFSVIRNLQQADADTDRQHVVWVPKQFKESRTPALDYRYSNYSLDESQGARLALSTILALFSVRRLLQEEQFDIIHAHMRGTLPLAALITKVLRRPVIFTNHNYARRRRIYRWVSTQRRMYTVVLTHSMGRYYGIEIRPPVVSVIPAFCSNRFFEEPLVSRQTTFSPERKLRLAGIGMLVPWKGWHTVAEAIGLLSPEEKASIEFTHWGEVSDPAYKERLSDSVHSRQLDDTMRFRGNTDQISSVLHEVDWLMHPAVMDPFPVSVIEALALGLPALVSNSGGPVDMVKPGQTGLLFEPENAADLAEKLRMILCGKIQILPPEEVRESVRHISATNVAARYNDLYLEVLNSTNS